MPMETLSIDITSTKEDAINSLIKNSNIDAEKISDGCYTFGQLRHHRALLFIVLCREIANNSRYKGFKTVWRTRKYFEGDLVDPYGFMLAIETQDGVQITHELPASFWEMTSFATTIDFRPKPKKNIKNNEEFEQELLNL